MNAQRGVSSAWPGAKFFKEKLVEKPVRLCEAEVRPIRIHENLKVVAVERELGAVDRVICVSFGGVTNVEAEPQTGYTLQEKNESRTRKRKSNKE